MAALPSDRCGIQLEVGRAQVTHIAGWQPNWQPNGFFCETGAPHGCPQDGERCSGEIVTISLVLMHTYHTEMTIIDWKNRSKSGLV